MSPSTILADDSVLDSFRFGPSYRLLAGVWWLLGPLPLVLFAIGAVVSGDPINLFAFAFVSIVPMTILGLALLRMRISITERHVILHRLRKPVAFSRSDTTIEIISMGGNPRARISDGRKTRDSAAVTAMRRDARKLRHLATYVPVTMLGVSIEPLPESDLARHPRI